MKSLKRNFLSILFTSVLSLSFLYSFSQELEVRMTEEKLGGVFACIDDGRLVTYLLNNENYTADIKIVDENLKVEKTITFELDKAYFPKKVGATYIFPRFYVEENYAVLHLRKSGTKRGEYKTLIVDINNHQKTVIENDENDQSFKGVKALSPYYTHAFSDNSFSILNNKLILNKYKGTKSGLYITTLGSTSGALKPLNREYSYKKNVFHSIHAIPDENQFMVVSTSEDGITFICLDINGREVYTKVLDRSSLESKIDLASLKFEPQGSSLIVTGLCLSKSSKNVGMLLGRVNTNEMAFKYFGFTDKELKIKEDVMYEGKSTLFPLADLTVGVSGDNIVVSGLFAARDYNATNLMGATLNGGSTTMSMTQKYYASAIYIFKNDFSLEDQMVQKRDYFSRNASMEKLTPLFLQSDGKLSFLYCTNDGIEGYIYDGKTNYVNVYEGFSYFLHGSDYKNIVIIGSKNPGRTNSDLLSGEIQWMYKKFKIY